MTSQNLFEKYGIKEVADVTLYRIEKKEETYESQRQINASSILKGALELREVFPLNDNGVGEEEGFQAYVFTDATLIEGTNYDCDDSTTLNVKMTVTYDEGTASARADGYQLVKAVKDSITEDFEDIFNANFGDGDMPSQYSVSLSNATDTTTGVPVSSDKIEEMLESGTAQISLDNLTVNLIKDNSVEVEGEENTYRTKGIFSVTAIVTIDNDDDSATGVYSDSSAASPDAIRSIGTHEYSYAEQVAMLFAKRQNLISKTGVRYIFNDADTMFGNIDFNDNFAAAPYSTERIVVAGVADKFEEGNYDIEEINSVIGQLKDSITAKAYDVVYNDYAELVVEDEMGYYNPKFLGKDYKRVQGEGKVTFFETMDDYKTYVGNKVDNAIADSEMWSAGVHYSINDAIDALRQKKLILDASEENGTKGIKSIFGGYKVDNEPTPEPGKEDISANYASNKYGYKLNGTEDAVDKDGNVVTSDYPLDNVTEALKKIGATGAAFDKDLKVVGGDSSNRAIYVRVDGAVDTAAGAYIYLLKNKNAKKLLIDNDGIFWFNDKQGNKLYYQDKIFKGIEYLALVILGDKGLIFVVNRHGGKNTSRVAWMVNENGYLNDKKASVLVKNGLIHTTNITVNDETFEATCTVGSLKVHKTVKVAKRYTPVLFLDTLKVSTIEQTAEEVFANGGKGNADLIGWDYGKEITVSMTDALFTPASMSAIYGAGDGKDIRSGVKEAKVIDRMEKVTAKRNFIVPAGNQNGTPTEADKTAQAVFIDPNTMNPYPDGTPIVEGEVFYKWTRSVAYEGQSIGSVIEISADKFPGTYKLVGDTCIRNKTTHEDERFQFVIPEAKMNGEHTITLEADGDPAVFDFSMKVLRPDDGVMVRFIQYDVVENEEENDGSTMVKGTENLNLLDDAELFRVSAEGEEDEAFIGATEY